MGFSQKTFENEPDMPEVLSPVLQKFLQYWQALPRKNGRDLPAYTSVDLVSLERDLLDGVGIIELVNEPDKPRRYKFGYVGTKLYEFTDYEQTNLFLDKIHPPEEVDDIYTTYDGLRNNPEVTYLKYQNLLTGKEYQLIERLLAPLCDDDGAVVRFIGFWARLGLAYKT